MNIVLDTVPLIYSQGADRRTTFHLYRELLALDHQDNFSFLCIDRRGRRSSYEQLLSIREVPVREVRLPFRVMEWAWNYLGWPSLEALMGNVDLYHVAGIHVPPTRRAKVFLTIHGIAAEVIPEMLGRKRVARLREVLRAAMRRTDYYLAVSATTKDDLVRRLGVDPGRIYVVTHGVDPMFRPAADGTALSTRLKARFGIDYPYILYVGFIGHHKNVMGLLKAYRALHAKGLDQYHMWLVGAPDSAWNEAHAFVGRYGFQDRIHLPGWISPDSQDLVDLYGAASCCVFPSFYEGWCSPPLEAMACGTAVVVSNRSSLPETVDDAALLVNPDDYASIADGITTVLTDDALRQDLVMRGLARVKECNWSASAQRLVSIYRQIEERL